jgi:hypothetical protein
VVIPATSEANYGFQKYVITSPFLAQMDDGRDYVGREGAHQSQLVVLVHDHALDGYLEIEDFR